MRKFITNCIRIFYIQPFRFIPFETFKYLASGVSTVLIDIFVFFISYNFIFNKQVVHTPIINLQPYTAALLVGIVASFCWGFVMNKYVVFTQSTLRGRVQLFRYAVIFGSNILFNYLLMKLFVEKMNFYPTVSKILITVIVSVYSYIAQRKFSFKTSE